MNTPRTAVGLTRNYHPTPSTQQRMHLITVRAWREPRNSPGSSGNEGDVVILVARGIQDQSPLLQVRSGKASSIPAILVNPWNPSHRAACARA